MVLLPMEVVQVWSTLLVCPVVPVVQFLLPSLSDFPDDEPECPQTHLNRIEKTKNMKLSLGFKSHPECFGGRLYPDLEIYGSFRKCCSVAHTSTCWADVGDVGLMGPEK